MKAGFVGIGLLLLLVGLVWTLQGANILPGSVMTGDPFWVLMGLLCAGLGGYLLYRGIAAPGRQ